MAADAWVVYNKWKQTMASGEADLDADTFKVGLYQSTSNAASGAATHDALADITNEVANGSGYTTGGATLGSVTWTESSGTVTFDFADPSWTASGGSIVARFAVVYDDTIATAGIVDAPVGYSLLDNTPADVTTTDGNTLTLVIHANGMFTLA